MCTMQSTRRISICCYKSLHSSSYLSQANPVAVHQHVNLRCSRGLLLPHCVNTLHACCLSTGTSLYSKRYDGPNPHIKPLGPYHSVPVRKTYNLEEMDVMVHYKRYQKAMKQLIEDMETEFSEKCTLGVLENMNVPDEKEAIIDQLCDILKWQKTSDGKFTLSQLAEVKQKNEKICSITMDPSQIPFKPSPHPTTKLIPYMDDLIRTIQESGIDPYPVPRPDGKTVFVALPITLGSRQHRVQLAIQARLIFERTQRKMLERRNTGILNRKRGITHEVFDQVTDFIDSDYHKYVLEADNIKKHKIIELLGHCAEVPLLKPQLLDYMSLRALEVRIFGFKTMR